MDYGLTFSDVFALAAVLAIDVGRFRDRIGFDKSGVDAALCRRSPDGASDAAILFSTLPYV